VASDAVEVSTAEADGGEVRKRGHSTRARAKEGTRTGVAASELVDLGLDLLYEVACILQLLLKVRWEMGDGRLVIAVALNEMKSKRKSSRP
jgi:hypothetical protein